MGVKSAESLVPRDPGGSFVIRSLSLCVKLAMRYRSALALGWIRAKGDTRTGQCLDASWRSRPQKKEEERGRQIKGERLAGTKSKCC